MSAGWNAINSTQQTQFLQAAGLNELPPAASLDSAQMNILAGIVGTETAKTVTGAPPSSGTVAAPAMPPPAKSAGDWSNIMALVAQLKVELGETMVESSAADIENRRVSVKERNDITAAQLQERCDKLAEKANASLISKIFGWIGAAFAVIGAAFATVVTGGAAAPALIAASVALAVMVLQETGAMEAITQALSENPAILAVLFPVVGGVLLALEKTGVIDQEQLQSIINLAVNLAVVAVSITCAVMTGGISSGGALNVISGLAGEIAGAIAQVGQGAADIAGAVYTKQAADIQADTQEGNAWLIRMQSMMNEEMDRLTELIRQIHEAVSAASDAIASISSSHQAIYRNMGV